MVYVKNTFIHCFEADNLAMAKRHHSYPPAPRDRGAFVLQLAQLDQAENLNSHCSHDSSHDSAPVEVIDVQSSGNAIQASSEKAPNEKSASSKKNRRTANRASTGKRERYVRFVEGVLRKIDEDPASFDFGHVTLPPSLLAHPKKLSLFQEQIQWYTQQVLAGEKPIKLRRFTETIVKAGDA